MSDTLIFIEYNVLISDNIMPLIHYVSKLEGSIVVDKDILNEIEALSNEADSSNYYQSKEVLHYFEKYHKLKYVDTSKYLSFENIQKYLEENKIDQFIAISQSINTISNLKNEIKDVTFPAYKYDENGKLIEWKIDKPLYKKAFYVEHISFDLEESTESIDYAYSTQFGYIKFLGEPIARGGEGIIYKTYNNMLAKVYFNKHLTYMNYKKIQAMIDKKIHNPYLAWPIDIIYSKGVFIGYLMPEIALTKSIDELRDLGFPGYSVKNRLEIALTFLKQVDYLHDRNIIVGDMKFDNILVRNSNEIFFVDTGSFQVDDYPCPVFLKEFTGRNFTTDDLKKTLRNIEDEYFPINKILFEMILLKNPFYSKDSIEIDVNAPREFHYPLDKSEIKEKPTTDQVIWFNLTNNMREYFYYYFKQQKITPLKTWIKELENFISKI